MTATPEAPTYRVKPRVWLGLLLRRVSGTLIYAMAVIIALVLTRKGSEAAAR